MNEQQPDDIDWSLTTWEGARQEQLRRWAALPLEKMLQTIEDMAEFAKSFPVADEAAASHAVPPAQSAERKL